MGDWYTKVKAEFILNFVEDNRWKYLLTGLGNTLKITLAAVLLGIVIGTLVAIVRSTWDQNAERMRPGAGKSLLHIGDMICKIYLTVIRGTPVLVQLFVVFYGLPGVGILIEPFPAAVLVFSINEGAYCAETMRAAIESIPKGQMEAGVCVGMSWLQTMFHVILPQAFRTAFPPLSNSLISMLKDTSLAANITVMEMFMVTQRIASRYYEHLALYIEVALIYLLFCTVLTKVQAVCEKKLAAYGF